MLFKKTEDFIRKSDKGISPQSLNSGVIETNGFCDWEDIHLSMEDREKAKAIHKEEYDAYNKNCKYFYGGLFNSYITTYNSRFDLYKQTFPDAPESIFIYQELIKVWEEIKFPFIDEITRKNMNFSLARISTFLAEKLDVLGFEICESENGEGYWCSADYKSYYVQKKTDFTIKNFVQPIKLKNVKNREFIEAFKAFYESNTLHGTQNEAYKNFCQIFSMKEEKNLTATLNEMKLKSSKSSLTPFLNKLTNKALKFFEK